MRTQQARQSAIGSPIASRIKHGRAHRLALQTKPAQPRAVGFSFPSLAVATVAVAATTRAHAERQVAASLICMRQKVRNVVEPCTEIACSLRTAAVPFSAGGRSSRLSLLLLLLVEQSPHACLLLDRSCALFCMRCCRVALSP